MKQLDRLTRGLVEAEAVFGDDAKAAAWMCRPNRSINGETPLALLAG